MQTKPSNWSLFENKKMFIAEICLFICYVDLHFFVFYVYIY